MEICLSRVKVDFTEGLRQLGRFSESGAKIAAKVLKEEIVREITEGRSPVKKAGGRFVRYSTSYKRAIDKGYYTQFNKRKRPVNLRFSGKLLSSIYAKPSGKSKFFIGFNNKLADIHNRQGASRSKVVRRMLPTNKGETFTDSIIFAVGISLQRVKRKIFR